MQEKIKNIGVGLVVFTMTLLSTVVHTRELPGDWPNGLQLGQGYDSARQQEVFAACVEGEHTDINRVVDKITYTSEADFDTIARAFSGFIEADVRAPFVKASASMEYASENATTDRRMNWFFEYRGTGQSRTFSIGKLRLSQDGEDAIKAGYKQVPTWCGDEFVSKIDYGASLIGTMSVEFASKEDKEEFKLAAALDVNFGLGSAKASGRMENMQQKMGSRTIVKVQAHQTGGNPGQINAILGTGQVVRCTLSDMANCLSAFENILRYANGDFKRQLDTVSGYSVTRYYTTAYSNSAGRRLVPPQGFAPLNQAVELKREQIQKTYEKELTAYKRAQYIQNRISHFASSTQMATVNDIFAKSWANIKELTRAMKMCLDFPDQSCLDSEPAIKLYNIDDLDIKIVEQLDPNSNLGKLHQAVKENNINAAAQVLSFGGEHLLNKCDPQGYNAFHQAIKDGNTQFLRFFIRKDQHKGHATKSLVHEPCENADAYTPLCLAAQGGTFEHVRCIDLLCAEGASVDGKTPGGLTPLQVAVSQGKVEIARKLLAKGADKGMRDAEGRMLLHLAAESGSVEMIEEFIHFEKPTANYDTDYQGMNALHHAAKNGNIEAVVALLRHGVPKNVKDQTGKMPIHWAIGNEKVLEKLLELHELPIKARDIWNKKNNDWANCQTCREFAFSPDSSQIAISGCGWIPVYLTNSGHKLTHFNIENSTSYGIGYSSDGRLLAAHDGSVSIKIWDLSSESHIQTLGSASKLDFSPCGYVLAVGNSEGKVSLYYANTAKPIIDLPKFLLYPNCIKFSPDGTILAVAAQCISLCNVQNGQLLRILSAEGASVTSFSFSADGKLVGASGDRQKHSKARIWNVQTGQLVHTLDSGWGGGLAFSPRDNLLAHSYFNGANTIEFWDTRNWKLVYETIPANNYEMIGNLKFNPLGSELASTDGTSYLRLWNMRFDSILHHAVRAGKLKAVRMIVKKFPLLPFIRTPQGQTPLEIAEELLARQGNNQNPELQQIITFLGQ